MPFRGRRAAGVGRARFRRATERLPGSFIVRTGSLMSRAYGATDIANKLKITRTFIRVVRRDRDAKPLQLGGTPLTPKLETGRIPAKKITRGLIGRVFQPNGIAHSSRRLPAGLQLCGNGNRAESVLLIGRTGRFQIL